MAISELQMGLLGVGVVAVVGIVAYNKWQEGRHRKRAERAFAADQPDVLLEPGLHGGGAPQLGGGDAFDESGEPAERPVRETGTRRAPPGAPPEASELADCVVRIESMEPLSGSRLWAAAAESMGDVGKPLRWFALDDTSNHWVEIDREASGSHHWFAAALQLVDRRGPVADAELVRFFHGLQRVADQFLAVPASMPARAEVLARAGDLDSFCASVDVQIGLNVVATDQPFAGTKLRGFAEAQGWVLFDDGSYHAADPDGRALFSVSNLDGAPFSVETMRELRSGGVTLLLDVPRTGNGVQAFERMLASARQIADSLRGQVVDDNRAPFGDAEAHVIRGQIEQYQARMHKRGLEAGGEVAQRLFAA